MQIHLLLLPICVLAFLNKEENHEEAKGRQLEQKFGKLSKENREKLTKAFGQNPETRKARLEHLLKGAPQHDLKDEQKRLFVEKLAEIPKIHTVKPNENATGDLFEVNKKEGVSDYFFQGDIYLTENQLSEIEMELSQFPDVLNRKKRQASTIVKKWPDNTV